MTEQVPDQDPRNQYTATGGQTVFPYTFLALADTDLAVDKNGVTLTLTVDYTVSDVGVNAGGDVTLLVGATAGDIITIFRDMVFDRQTDYQNNGDFLADTVNDDFNNNVLMAQQNKASLGRVLQVSDTDDVTGVSLPMNIPTKSVRASKGLGFDVSGNPIAVSLVADGTGDANLINYTDLTPAVISVEAGMNFNEDHARNYAIKMGVDSGVSNAYIWQSTSAKVTTLKDGFMFAFVPQSSNSGNTTVEILDNAGASLGVFPVYIDQATTNPASSDIRASSCYIFRYASNAVQLVSSSKITSSMIAASAVTTNKINDNAVNLNKMIDGTAGRAIKYDASGNPIETPETFRQWVTEDNSGQLTSGTEYVIEGIPANATRIVITVLNISSTNTGILRFYVGYGVTPTFLIASGDYIGETVIVNSGGDGSTVWDTFAQVNAITSGNNRAFSTVTLEKINDGSETWSISVSANDTNGSIFDIRVGHGRVKAASLVTDLSAVRFTLSVGTFDDGYITTKYYGNPDL